MALSRKTSLRRGEPRGGPGFTTLRGVELMKSLKIASVTTIMLIAAVAMAAEEAKPKAKVKGARLNSVSRTMMQIDRIKSAVEGLDLSEDQKDKLVKIRDDF